MRLICLLSVAVCIMLGQVPDDFPPTKRDIEAQDRRLPNGKSQRDEIIRADHKKNLEDAAQLIQLSQELKDDLDKGDAFIVSVKTLKKLDDIDKLAKDIRGRLKRY
ncbi:MAG: hypothetical protein JO307_19450 [Bryobacterales bacterium]|nr:hypothetical protein [Bryobacterales bacterium]